MRGGISGRVEGFIAASQTQVERGAQFGAVAATQLSFSTLISHIRGQYREDNG